mmetsp:Transcript_58781/g.108518  ORF Transcript_58781/g.108518 Transcript_58781/m.108518 type:complete len:221 (+) Transcript_58781:210-872(+)
MDWWLAYGSWLLPGTTALSQVLIGMTAWPEGAHSAVSRLKVGGTSSERLFHALLCNYHGNRLFVKSPALQHLTQSWRCHVSEGTAMHLLSICRWKGHKPFAPKCMRYSAMASVAIGVLHVVSIRRPEDVWSDVTVLTELSLPPVHCRWEAQASISHEWHKLEPALKLEMLPKSLMQYQALHARWERVKQKLLKVVQRQTNALRLRCGGLYGLVCSLLQLE